MSVTKPRSWQQFGSVDGKVPRYEEGLRRFCISLVNPLLSLHYVPPYRQAITISTANS